MDRWNRAVVVAMCMASALLMMGIRGCELNIKNPADGSSVMSPTDLRISYSSGASPVLTVRLNNVDISSSFTVAGPDEHNFMQAVYAGANLTLGPNQLDATLTTQDNGTLTTYTAHSAFTVILPPDPSGLVDEGPGVGKYSSVAFDQFGLPYVSYYDEDSGALKVARYSPSVGYDSVTLDGGDGENDEGLYTSILLTANNVAYISYYDQTGGSLKLARLEHLNLELETVDAPTDTDVGQFTSIAQNSSGVLYISYYDVTNGDLKLAVQNGDNWTFYVVDGQGDLDVGSWSRLIVEPSGVVHIAYEDRTNFNLKYAVGQPPNFTIYTVDASADFVGSDIGFDLKSNNLAVFSYFDATNLDLKFAQETTVGHFSSQTLYSPEATGFFSSLAVNRSASNKIFITFYDHTQRSLWLVESNGAGFDFSVLDNGGGGPDADIGRYTCLKMDAHNYLGVSYQDYANGQLFFKRIID